VGLPSADSANIAVMSVRIHLGVKGLGFGDQGGDEEMAKHHMVIENSGVTLLGRLLLV